jgi:hypothetical protein
LEQDLLEDFRKEVVHAVLCLASALSYLRISGAARKGGTFHVLALDYRHCGWSVSRPDH